MIVNGYRRHFEIRQGQFFNDKELESNDQLAFITKESFESRYDSLELDNKLILNERKYRIVGTGKGYMDEIIYIPYKNFLDSFEEVNNININFKKRLNTSEKEYLLEQVKKINGFSRIIIPKTNNNDFRELTFRLIIGCGIVFVSLLSIINIFRYLIEINIDKFIIHVICGMSLKRRSLLLLSEFLFMLGIIYILSSAIYETYIETSTLNLIQYIIGFLIIAIFVSVNVIVKIKEVLKEGLIERL